MSDEPQPLQPGQQLIVTKPGTAARAAEVIEIGEPADAVTMNHPAVVGGRYKRDVVRVRYHDNGEIEAVRHDHVTVVE